MAAHASLSLSRYRLVRVFYLAAGSGPQSTSARHTREIPEQTHAAAMLSAPHFKPPQTSLKAPSRSCPSFRYNRTGRGARGGNSAMMIFVRVDECALCYKLLKMTTTGCFSLRRPRALVFFPSVRSSACAPIQRAPNYVLLALCSLSLPVRAL